MDGDSKCEALILLAKGSPDSLILWVLFVLLRVTLPKGGRGKLRIVWQIVVGWTGVWLGVALTLHYLLQRGCMLYRHLCTIGRRWGGFLGENSSSCLEVGGAVGEVRSGGEVNSLVLEEQGTSGKHPGSSFQSALFPNRDYVTSSSQVVTVGMVDSLGLSDSLANRGADTHGVRGRD